MNRRRIEDRGIPSKSRRAAMDAALRAIAIAIQFGAMPAISASQAAAQAPEVASIEPSGGPRGGITEVRLTGENLEGAKVISSGRGLTVQSVADAPDRRGAVVRLSVSADAPVGSRELRVITPDGASNPVRFWVDAFGNVAEAEPNDDAAHAQRIEKTPIVVNGSFHSAGDRDFYSLDMAAGETWVFDVNANRIASPAVVKLELRDQSAAVVGRLTAGPTGDPRLVFECLRSGRYTLELHEGASLGGPAYRYRLTVGRLPIVTRTVPLGEKPGRKVALKLEGSNLGSNRRAVVSIPADTATGLYWTTVNTPSGASLPFPLIVDFAPVIGLTETDALMPLPTLPCSMEGVFETYPKLRFAFQASPMHTILFSLASRQIGAGFDGVIRIADLDGHPLAESQERASTAALTFTPKTEGVYAVEIADPEGKTGSDRYYRFSATAVEPDFRVYLDADRFNVAAGSTVSAPIRIERLSAFEGPIRISAAGLPTGVSCPEVLVPPGAVSAELRISAAQGAVAKNGPIRLEAASEDSPVSRAAGTTAAKKLRHTVVSLFKRKPAPGGSEASYPCELLPVVVIRGGK